MAFVEEKVGKRFQEPFSFFDVVVFALIPLKNESLYRKVMDSAKIPVLSN